MANYYEAARSNYFRVKDEEAFKKALEPFDVDVHSDNEGRFCLLNNEEGGWPSWYLDDNEQEHDVDFFQLVSEHLADKSIAVFIGSGAEKLRYISGYAVAIHPNGERIQIVLDDIYKEAQEAFGDDVEITPAEY